MKTCPTCQRQTPRFWIGVCQTCYNRNRRKEDPERAKAKDRMHHLRHQEKRAAYAIAWNKEHKIEIKNRKLAKQSRVDSIKMKSPCADCRNFFPPECMDFDHRPEHTKKSNVSRMVTDNLGWEEIEKEICKCDIVCANCHRTRTKYRLKEAVL